MKSTKKSLEWKGRKRTKNDKKSFLNEKYLMVANDNEW